MPCLLFLSLSGMAAGAWLAGFLYDGFGSYALAWQVGIAANLAALAILGGLALRQGGRRQGGRRGGGGGWRRPDAPLPRLWRERPGRGA